jgi:polyether ionophore transport system permease protein
LSAKAATTAGQIGAPVLKPYRWPQTVIGRFVARRTLRSATFVALAFGAFVASKTVGYAVAYPTVHARVAASAAYVNNIGLIALFGEPHHLGTVTGFAVWYALAIGVVLGSIWAYLVATKAFRGEEEGGRWELLLTGQTTARRAAASTLAGLGVGLGIFYVITAATLIAVGRDHKVNFATGPALFFALAAVSAAVMFMAVGALASQLMPTRARAAGLATGIFGACFLVRAAGDITSAHWLLNITPLGWIEQLQPLFHAQPLWLLPIAAFTTALAAASVILAGRRDLGASIFADRDTAPSHTRLLGSSFTAAIRFTRASSVGWLAALTVLTAFFAALTNTAAQIFSDSTTAQHLLNNLVKTQQNTAARTFLGIAFMLGMLVIMAYAAASVGAMRSDEAQGYLDNLLVRPIGRGNWFWSRASLILAGIISAGLLAAAAAWLGLAGHHAIISFHDLLLAGLNTVAPAVFTLGAGLCAFGLVPRLTTVIAYGVIAWSFLLQMVSAGLNLNHWVLDTSILSQVALAPAVNPKWGTNWTLIIIGLALAFIGALAFNRRDLATE